MAGAILPTTLFFVTLFSGAAAQNSTVVCGQDFSWSLNSRGQTPCTVAAYLQQACIPDKEWDIQPLPPDAHYAGPLKGQDTKCQCNSVVYQLVSACADCQGATVTKWSSWIRNCSNIYPNGYPLEVPTGTAIPPWAYLSISQSNSYDRATAQARANGSSTPGTFRNGTTPGEIAGIVIGSVAVLGLIFAVIWYIRRQTRPPASKPGLLSPAYIRFPNPAAKDAGVLELKSPDPVILMTSVKHSPKYYDPADPSTWPPPALSPQFYNTQSRRNYPGIPEL